MSENMPPWSRELLEATRVPIMLSGHAFAWQRAVELQAERAGAAGVVVDGHADAYLLIVAIRQVIRAAEAMNRAVGGDTELQAALDAFLEGHPKAKDVRDVLEHFDAYEGGSGNLQKAGKVGQLNIRMERGEERFWLVLADGHPDGLRVELSAAAEDARRLASLTMEAEHRFRTATMTRRATEAQTRQ